MIVTSVQIKTAKTQKHLYCPVFTKTPFAFVNGIFTFYLLPLHSYLKIKSSGIERYLTIFTLCCFTSVYYPTALLEPTVTVVV